MGQLVDGHWHEVWDDRAAIGTRFARKDAAFRNWVTKDGGPGPTGEGGFKAESRRYHLYVSLACPWAHRTLILRSLKGLEDAITVSTVGWLMLDQGWAFDPDSGADVDPINDARFLHEVYAASDPTYTGRVTVPVLWDKQTGRIVSNESSEIIRMLNSAFDEVGGLPGDYYPKRLREEIDRLNARIYDTVNNGVYKAGFAASQEAYEEAVASLFETLDWLEELLAGRRYVAGGNLTEADIRLFTTLIRFDAVYFGHFKCNVRRIVDYPNLIGFVRDLYQRPTFSKTVNFDHIKRHYYGSHRRLNPSGIVPVGPALDLAAPHCRARPDV